jgi:hypothetical protein
LAELANLVLAEQVPDTPGNVVVGQRAVERYGTDAIEQRQQYGDAVTARLGWWVGG